MPQTANLDDVYRKIGKRLVELMRQKSLPLSFATKTTGAKRKTMPNCTPGKSWSCGWTCLPMSKKNCGSPLPGQAATYAQYLVNQSAVNGGATPPATPATPKTTKSKKTATTPPPAPATTGGAGGQTIVNIADVALVTTNQKELNKSRSDLEKRFGSATVEAAEKNVKKIMDDPDTNVYIRVGSADTLERILGDRFKTAHELGSTANVPNMKGTYLDNRARVEEKTMGVDKNTAPGDRPIYGYIAGKNLDGASHADVAQSYGSIAVKLKSDIKDRTTFTGADSFKSGIASEMKGGATPPPPNAASIAALTRHGYDNGKLPAHLDHLDSSGINGSQLQQAAKAKNVDDLAKVGAPTGNRYIEAQVHGKVTSKDIAEITFTPKGQGDRPTAAIAQFAKDNGVPLVVNGKKLTSKELDDIITPPADKRSKTLQALSSALDKDDFDAVMKHATTIAKTSDKLTLAPYESDRDLKALYAEAGYDGKPRVGTSADLDKIHKDGGLLMVRGVAPDPKDKLGYLKQFQSGDYHVGNGIYGNGTYVGHSGYINSKGQFAHKNDATAAKDAKRAVDNVAKHGYMSSQTLNFRMAVDQNFNVVTQSNLLKDRDSLVNKVNGWAATQRQKLLAGAKTATKADVAAFNKKLQSERSGYDIAQATLTFRSKGARTEFMDFKVPSTSGKAPKTFTVERYSALTMTGNRQNTFAIRDSDGAIVASHTQASAKASSATLKKLFDGATEHEVLKQSGFDRPPKIGDISDPVAAKKVKQFDDSLDRTKQVLGLDHNGYSRLAVIRGYDGVALDQSYEPDTFLNLLNRSKITVQDDPLDWKRAKKTGAA